MANQTLKKRWICSCQEQHPAVLRLPQGFGQQFLLKSRHFFGRNVMRVIENPVLVCPSPAILSRSKRRVWKNRVHYALR